MLLDWQSAFAFARWTANQTGRPWRLPTELEWEKAARGVDGRAFPWGDNIDPSWCCLRNSHPAWPHPHVVSDFPIDVSPYGVRGMAGNIQDWCLDAYPDGLRPTTEPNMRLRRMRAARGGHWLASVSEAHLARRSGIRPWERWPTLGFRLCRSF